MEIAGMTICKISGENPFVELTIAFKHGSIKLTSPILSTLSVEEWKKLISENYIIHVPDCNATISNENSSIIIKINTSSGSFTVKFKMKSAKPHFENLIRMW